MGCLPVCSYGTVTINVCWPEACAASVCHAAGRSHCHLEAWMDFSSDPQSLQHNLLLITVNLQLTQITPVARDSIANSEQASNC